MFQCIFPEYQDITIDPGLLSVHSPIQILLIVPVVSFIGLGPSPGFSVVSLVFNMEQSFSSCFCQKRHKNDAGFFSVHPIGMCALLICCITGDVNSYYFVKSICQISLLGVNKSVLISIHGEIL